MTRWLMNNENEMVLKEVVTPILKYNHGIYLEGMRKN